MGAIASDRGWGWPVLAAAVAFVGATVLALFHQQLDLSTYLLGGAHASSDDLFTVTYPTDHLGFTYPPFSALLFAPFAHLPARVCEVVFSWVNLAALFGMIVVSLRAVCRSLDKRTLLWWGLALVLPVLLFDPVRQTFLLGQVNIILALMIVADLTMDLPLPRGILVGLAAAIKVTPVILIPYLFLTRQGRSGVRAIASFVAAALLAAAVNASTSWSYWTHYIRDPQRAGMLSWVGNQGVLGAVERMLGHTVTTPTTFVIVVTVGVLGLLVAAGAYRRSSPVLGLLVVEATESLASPVSWSHHFIWMILLVAWLALAEDRPRAGEWYALGVAVLLWAAPYWWVPHGPSVRFAGRGWLLPVGNAYVLVFIVLADRGRGPGGPLDHAAPRAPGPAGDGADGRRWLLSVLGRSGVSRVRRRRRAGLADEDDHVGARVEAPPGRGFGVGDPPARDDHQLLGVAGAEVAAPGLVGDLAQQAGGRAQRLGGPAPSGATEKVATSTLPGAARSRSAPQIDAVASSVKVSNTVSADEQRRRVGVVSRRVERRAEVVRVVQEVEPEVGRRAPSRCRARGGGCACPPEPAGRSTSNQRVAPPPKRRARPSSPAPRRTTWRGAAAEAAGHLGVDDLRALRQRGGAPDGGAHGAGDVAVEAPLRLDVTAGGRGARALQAESLRRDEARRQRGMPGAAQVGIALAVAVPGWPKRNDR